MLNQIPLHPNLLLTKTFWPVARSKQVNRDRLIKLLAADYQRPLTLIIAPAGYGKTTLLSQWLASMVEAQKQVAWVSLDEFDNEPVRFWNYICEGLSRVSPAIEKTLLGFRKQDVAPIDCPLITTLINEASRLNIPVNLVMDDYHIIHNRKIHEAIEFLIHHLPPNLKIVIASRMEPPFSLARLRASEQIMEIQPADLQFNLEETDCYLNQVMNLNLRTVDINQLSSLTWGWITGLQLAAVSLKGKRNIDGLITGIKSGNRYILEYLFEEVFNCQEEEIKSFLLKTSILDKFNTSLCDAVCGSTNSTFILDCIYQANLFVSVLDESNNWYHYHPLFSNLLQSELSRRKPEILPELHTRASEWYEENGLIEQAIKHSLAVGGHERIERLLQKDFFMVSNLLLWGDRLLLRKWLDQLKNEIIENSPYLTMLMQWVDIHHLQFDEINAIPHSPQNQRNTQNRKMGSGRFFIVETDLKITQACTLMLSGDYANSIDLAQQALENLNDPSYYRRCYLLWALAESYDRLGNTKKAYRLFSEAVAFSDLDSVLLPFFTYEMGCIEVVFGNLNRARQIFEKGLNRNGNGNKNERLASPAGLLFVGLGRLYIEWNQLELAELNIARGIELLGSQTPIDWILEAQIALAILKQARGEFYRASEILTRISHISKTKVIPREVGSQIHLELCKVALVMGDLESAKFYEKILEEKIRACDTFYSINLQITQARIRLSEKKWDGVLENLEHQLVRALDAGFGSIVLEIMLLKAIYWKLVGETSLAFDQVMRALSIAYPEGYVVSIIKENGIHDLLENIGQKLDILYNKPDPVDLYENYIRGILESLRNRARYSPSSTEALPDQADKLEKQLTVREVEILRLIAKGIDRKQIPQVLYISKNTMKTHLRNIYEKLGVHSLSEAVTFAYQHKLL